MRLRLTTIQQAAADRPEGYLEDVLSKCQDIGDGLLEISEEDYLLLKRKYSPEVTEGAGTELKLLLAGFPFHIKTTPGCACNKRARVMNERGIDWCEQNILTIVGWLKEEHARQKISFPFSPLAARTLISVAIKRARRKAAG